MGKTLKPTQKCLAGEEGVNFHVVSGPLLGILGGATPINKRSEDGSHCY